MSLNPWLPVPITPRAIRLLGRDRPAEPQRRAGDDRLGHVNPQPAEGPERVAGREDRERDGHEEAVLAEVAGLLGRSAAWKNRPATTAARAAMKLAIMFIAPARVPACRSPMSAAAAQAGPIARSLPKKVRP